MNTWHAETPEPGLVAWVWHDTAEVLATWTGKAWIDAGGHVLRGVTHWRTE